MNQFVLDLKKEMEETLMILENQELNPLIRCQKSIQFMEQVFERLKKHISGYRFSDELEEILFFKEIKPSFFCNLIFYRKIYEIELNKPKGGVGPLENYLKKELERINDYFTKNRDIYNYYRSGNTYMDKSLFLRKNSCTSLPLESFYMERDPLFATGCDFKVSKILANDMLESYLVNEVCTLDKSRNSTNFSKSELRWTGSKIDFIELAYALDSAKCINHGKVQLKIIVESLSEMLNIELDGNLSRAFYDLRIRNSRTALLDKMKAKLIDRMDRLDS